VAKGVTYDEALSGRHFSNSLHLETFGTSEIDDNPEILSAFVAET
jgi:hypothetical protein